ncbi:MAG: outer membrane lipid asymmetry maintenance protein MlaD [Gammaproteobacteria bacterium]|nr:outer membrane lipid asymmetry maintenance protein MlaD [Gammaproteobacteria bacterium]
MNSKWVEFTTGIFTISGIVALIVLVFQSTNFSHMIGSDVYKITASFDNVSGLKERSAVSVGGVKVGRVSQIDIDKDSYEAVVTIEIDKQYDQIPEDSSLSVFTAGLLGEKYIGMQIGGAPDFLKEGSHINLTQSSIVLEKLISQFLFSQSEKK